MVTGAAGFVGSHLCRRLLRTNYSVIGMDNLQTGSLKNLADIFDHPSFSFQRRDVTEPFDVAVDQIYNLACPAAPVHYQRTPIETTKTCVLGAINALELGRRRHARVLQASTSEVYGDPIEHPQRESYWGNVNPIGVRACYDEGKRCAETLFFDYARQYGVEIRVARIFNTYGPNMQPDDGRVVSNFIVQALKNMDITIYGDGKQTRSFCYVDDNLNGLIGLMNSDYSDPVNIGRPTELTIAELADMILSLTRSRSRLRFVRLPTDDPKVRRPDITRAREILDWSPKVALEDGLVATISYFRSLLLDERRETEPTAGLVAAE